MLSSGTAYDMQAICHVRHRLEMTTEVNQLLLDAASKSVTDRQQCKPIVLQVGNAMTYTHIVISQTYVAAQALPKHGAV